MFVCRVRGVCVGVVFAFAVSANAAFAFAVFAFAVFVFAVVAFAVFELAVVVFVVVCMNSWRILVTVVARDSRVCFLRVNHAAGALHRS